MGADGGVVGILLKNPENKENYDILRKIIPWEILYFDNRDENYEHGGFKNCIESTYGTGQDFSLEDLPSIVENAKEYGNLNPSFTFKDWVLDIYTHSYQHYINYYEYRDAVKFLATKYLGFHWHCNERGFTRSPDQIKDEQQEPFYLFNIKKWEEDINKLLNLNSIYSDETWT